MQRILCTLLVFLTLGSCKKVKENIIQNQTMSFITIGQWKVTRIVKDNVDNTADLSTYKFQFKDNSTVDAIKNGTVEIRGTWSGNATEQTITSQFPQNAVTPLKLLNGIFKITDGGLNHVEARKTENSVITDLRLER